jgi:ethanolamine utilization protein EutN
MQIAKVVGHAVATMKHPTLTGWKLLLVQPLSASGTADGEPVLAIDHLGAGLGAKVVVSNDGKAVQELVKTRATPLRWMVLGLCDG